MRSLSGSFASSFLTTSRCAWMEMRSFSSTTYSEYDAFSGRAPPLFFNNCARKCFLCNQVLQAVCGNHIEPTRKTLRFLQRSEFLIGFQECILCNLLGDVKISDFSPREGVHLFLIFFHKFGKSGIIAVENTMD